MVKLASPYGFLLFFLFLYLIYYYYKSGPLEGIFFPISAQSRIGFIKFVKHYFQYLFLILTVFFISIAISKPMKKISSIPIQKNGRAFIFCVDISSSMKALDIENKSRLEVSINQIKNFIHKRPYDLFGVVLFAKYAFTYIPLTFDHNFVLNRLNRIKIGMIEDGTSIGYGIYSAVMQLKNFKGSGKIIILLSDGNNKSGMISPIEAAKIAKKNNIKIYSIIPGKSKNVPFPFTGSDGRVVIKYIDLPINIALLTKVSEITGINRVFNVYDKKSFEKIFSLINKYEPITYKTNLFIRYKADYLKFIRYAYISFLLFVLFNLINIKVEY